ncbi:hypothetical protein, partial [Enterobacter hormaechei]|uniref:hypothetical protein n=1 Tax=Enterobacter hormaechei TaxID=158836 RepID=UPI001CC2A8C5
LRNLDQTSPNETGRANKQNFIVHKPLNALCVFGKPPVITVFPEVSLMIRQTLQNCGTDYKP